MSSQRAVVIADGDVDASTLRRAVAPGSLLAAEAAPAPGPSPAAGSPLVIAADGGARHAIALGIPVDIVVGDLDSLAPTDLDRLAAAGTSIQRASPDKDESDTELAIRAALDAGSTRITLVGALGGERLDHALANLLLLAHPMLDDVEATIVDREVRIQRTGTTDGPGTIELDGRPGDLVTLLPIAGVVEGVVTDGLRYPLRAEDLQPGPARGLSNVMSRPTAQVRTRRGRLLVIHTRPTSMEDTP